MFLVPSYLDSMISMEFCVTDYWAGLFYVNLAQIEVIWEEQTSI